MLPKWVFWRSRLRAIWFLLTSRWFVVITSNKDSSKMNGQYNVNHPSFLFLAEKLGPHIENNEGQAQALREAKEILARHD